MNAATRVLLLTQWRFVERVTAVPLVPPLGHLTTLGVAIAAVLPCAFIPLAPGLLSLVALPMTLIQVWFVTPIVRRLHVSATVETDALVRDRAEGTTRLRDGKLHLARLYEPDMGARVPAARFALVTTAMYLPLIAAFWLG